MLEPLLVSNTSATVNYIFQLIHGGACKAMGPRTAAEKARYDRVEGLLAANGGEPDVLFDCIMDARKEKDIGGTVFQEFWEAAEAFPQEHSVVHDRRHGTILHDGTIVTYMPAAMSLRDFWLQTYHKVCEQHEIPTELAKEVGIERLLSLTPGVHVPSESYFAAQFQPNCVSNNTWR
ncbi:hypothetical protein CYMTET_16279 [Cymbomonas tetramitiformis]|uniref:Uncharacterized protein n=1 Tax=Cymbomonas tetramitiformis TaxID=36881 RepID=A0AAE0GDS2_9CHLO|nr:hypothetical protein CYMTET_16279 [Cymbomonas tetramitiformis]